MEFSTILEQFNGRIFNLSNNTVIRKVDVFSRMNRLIKQYKDAGIHPGEPVTLIIASGTMFILHFFSLQRFGALPILLSNQTKPIEWLKLKRKYSLRSIVTDCWSERDCTQLENEKPCIKKNCTDDTFSSIIIQIQDEVQILSKSNVYIQPTSGSTGDLKLCVRSGKSTQMEAFQIACALKQSQGASVLCPLPLNHAFGFGSALMLSLCTSSDLFLMDEFNPRSLIRMLAKIEFNLLTAVPAMLELLLKMNISKTFLPSDILSAGSPLEVELYNRFYKELGYSIKAAYGTTETGKISIDCVGGAFIEGNAGYLLKGNKISISQKESCHEIMARTLSMMDGYLLPDGNINPSLNEEGMFATGDIGSIAEDGRILIQGRIKHIINVFGVKVNPLEVSSVLRSMRCITDAHVYSGKHRNGSDLVFGIVSVSEEVTEAEILAYCQERLNPQKVPSRIFLVDRLPRSQTGKIIPADLPKV